MSDEPTIKQRDMMRALFTAHGGDENAVCRAYVEAEQAGRVKRNSNEHSEPAESYARRLWKDGKAKGWLA